MSAVLIIDALVIDEGRVPNYGAALRTIDRLGPESVEDSDCFDLLDPDDELQAMREIRGQLRSDLRQLQEAVDNQLEIAELTIRGATVYISGGMSHGDAPTDICDAISRLCAVRGVLAAAGFDK